MMAGDEIRFRRGDIFYGAIYPKAGIDAEHRTTLTAWGEGSRPIISQYKITAPDAWEQIRPNIYRIDMTDVSLFSGNRSELCANAGFIKVSGRIYYKKRTDLSELSEPFDFYCDNEIGHIYLYLETNPALVSEDIRIACNIRCIAFIDHIAVIGLELCGTGGHGISGVTEGAYISDCYLHEIGGSELIGYPQPNVRYGNGIEAWSNSHDVTVEACAFADIYDVAITMQGNHVTRSWENMYFRRNRFWNCTQCLEIWSEGADPAIGFVNCEFSDNTCLFTGEGWGYAARPNKEVATPLLLYHVHTHCCDVKIKNNLFAAYHDALLFKSGALRKCQWDIRLPTTRSFASLCKHCCIGAKGRMRKLRQAD